MLREIHSQVYNTTQSYYNSKSCLLPLSIGCAPSTAVPTERIITQCNRVSPRYCLSRRNIAENVKLKYTQ